MYEPLKLGMHLNLDAAFQWVTVFGKKDQRVKLKDWKTVFALPVCVESIAGLVHFVQFYFPRANLLDPNKSAK